MKTWKRIAIFALALWLLAPAAAPALAASEVTLTIRNLTQSNTTLILRGPTDLEITIERQVTKVRVEPGNYSYRYQGCGRMNTGTFSVGSNGATFKLKKCEKGLYATLVINNLTGNTFGLTLNGPKHYFLSIIPGDHKYTVFAGRYVYSAFVCGERLAGEKGLKSKQNPDWVWRCE
ncbi:MAG: hypothetical protein M1347_06095 [Chloroflexi bacterium]|nr:hypothetical protein [Chloroflexota bacterium]